MRIHLVSDDESEDPLCRLKEATPGRKGESSKQTLPRM